MKITLKQLKLELKSKLQSVYLLSGEDPYLVEHAQTSIENAAKLQGFNEVLTMQADKNFDWQSFFTKLYTSSIFIAKRFIVLNISQWNLTDETKSEFLKYAANPITSQILLLIFPKLTTAQQNTKWWKAMLEKSRAVMIYPLNDQEMKAFVQDRLQQAGVTINPKMVEILLAQGAGNPFAIEQAIQKLQLIQLSQPIDLAVVHDCIADSAQYNIFQLADYVLLADQIKILKTLEYLKQSAAEPVLILWGLVREVRLMLQIHEQLSAGAELFSILPRLGVWRTREPIIRKAAARSTLAFWQKCLEDAQAIDFAIKGIKPDDIWWLLENFCLQMSGTKIL